MTNEPEVRVFYIETVIGDFNNSQRNSFLLCAENEEDAYRRLEEYDKVFAQNVDFIIDMGKWEGYHGVKDTLNKDGVVDVPWKSGK